jgi:hypothetical protein
VVSESEVADRIGDRLPAAASDQSREGEEQERACPESRESQERGFWEERHHDGLHADGLESPPRGIDRQALLAILRVRLYHRQFAARRPL